MTSSFSSTAQATHKRLQQESWVDNQILKKALETANAKWQRLENGSGKTVSDEYSFTVDKMPAGMAPEKIISELATDMNGTVNSSDFNDMCEFQKFSSEPGIGTIISIDIVGPDNGSVIISEKTSNYFIVSTIETPDNGTHPENGSREFGFDKNSDGSILFYTRGVSRPYSFLHAAGRTLQEKTWKALVKGLSENITSKGGTIRSNSQAQLIAEE